MLAPPDDVASAVVVVLPSAPDHTTVGWGEAPEELFTDGGGADEGPSF